MKLKYSLFISLTLIAFTSPVIAYQLPINGDVGDPVIICNKFANKTTGNIFQKYPIDFDNKTDKPMFYAAMSSACVASGIYGGHGVPMFNALKWTADSTYPDLAKYSHHKIPDNILLDAIKNTVIFGYMHAKSSS